MGLTGVVGAGSDGQVPTLNGEEVARIRASLVQSSCPPAMLDDAVHIAFQIRALDSIARAGTNGSRIAELDLALTAARSPSGRRHLLSTVNEMLITRLRRQNPDMQYDDLLEMALKHIQTRRPGRGNRPHDERDAGAIMLANAFRNHTGRHPSSDRNGHFVPLLTDVFSAALRKDLSSLHRLAERVLHGTTEQEGPGVTAITPKRKRI